MTKDTRTALPDFRNLGILLRVALAVQALGLAAALVDAPGLGQVLGVFLGYAAYLEPPLLISLLLLFLLAPRLAALSGGAAVAASLALALFATGVWHGLFLGAYADLSGASLARALVLAGVMAGAVLALLDWRARRLSPALSEARLQALQSRIRPHFLFNTLNSVLSLMRSDPGRAEAALENLAELYRALMADNRQLSTLGKELDLARAYLELEGLRLGERLAVDWRVENGPRQALMPALVLQPLLENAVCHGIEPQAGGGRIGVDIFARDNQLNVVVRNPHHAEPNSAGNPGSPPGGPPVRRGNRMALTNIRERLALHFDAEARLSAHQVGDEFVVQLVIPLREAKHGA